MDNYIKTIINGLKAWVSGEIDLVKRYILRMMEKMNATANEQYKGLEANIKQNTDSIEMLANIPAVKIDDISDIGGHPSSTMNVYWNTDAPFVIFYTSGGETVVGTRIQRFNNGGAEYMGFSSRGRPVIIDGGDGGMCFTQGGYRYDDPDFSLTVAEIWDSLSQNGGKTKALSANQGFELQKQITALTERVAALEGATT